MELTVNLLCFVNRHTGGLENVGKTAWTSKWVNRHTGGLETDRQLGLVAH